MWWQWGMIIIGFACMTAGLVVILLPGKKRNGEHAPGTEVVRFSEDTTRREADAEETNEGGQSKTE